MADGNRRFVVQIVHVVEECWFSGPSKEPVRTERHYSVSPIAFSAPDEEAAYQRAMALLRDYPMDRNHDGLGHQTRYFVLGIHDLVEMSLEWDWDECTLPGFSLSNVDAEGAPYVPQREHLTVFRERCWKPGATPPERAVVSLEKSMGPPIDARRPSAEFLQSKQTLYPQQLVELWREHGFAGYERGLFWTTNPEELGHFVRLFHIMFHGDRSRDVIGRDAFANLYVLIDGERVERYCPHTHKHDPLGSIEWFVQRHITYPRSQRDYLWRDLFEPALATHGPLTADECYAFVPIIPLGGKRAAPFVRRLPFRKYLERLAAVWNRSYPKQD